MTSSAGDELISSSAWVTSVKSAHGLRWTSGPIDRTPGTPGSDNYSMTQHLSWIVKLVVAIWKSSTRRDCSGVPAGTREGMPNSFFLKRMFFWNTLLLTFAITFTTLLCIICFSCWILQTLLHNECSQLAAASPPYHKMSFHWDRLLLDSSLEQSYTNTLKIIGSKTSFAFFCLFRHVDCEEIVEPGNNLL